MCIIIWSLHINLLPQELQIDESKNRFQRPVKFWTRLVPLRQIIPRWSRILRLAKRNGSGSITTTNNISASYTHTGTKTNETSVMHGWNKQNEITSPSQTIKIKPNTTM